MDEKESYLGSTVEIVQKWPYRS